MRPVFGRLRLIHSLSDSPRALYPQISVVHPHRAASTTAVQGNTLSMTITMDPYRPHLLPIVPGAEVGPDGTHQEEDWTHNIDLKEATALSLRVWGAEPLRVLVLYGSLRER
jgi:hypothetical protein